MASSPMFYILLASRYLPVKSVLSGIILHILGACLLLQPALLFAEEITMEVTSNAYNSVFSQTTAKNPALTAWGDTLKPGMKAIAVSRDLIKLGLTYKTKVTIKGLEGEYQVMDKMNKRWSKKIDIYMGYDIKKARKWGVRKVSISWNNSK